EFEHLAADALEETLAGGLVDIIHAVAGQPKRARLRGDEATNAPQEQRAIGISHIKVVEPPRRSERRHHAETGYLRQERSRLRSGHVECDTRKPDPVEIALQDRGQAIPPRRKDEDQALA